MAVTFNDTSDQVLQYIYGVHACQRTAIEDSVEKKYGRNSGVNPLSSISQLVLDDLIEKSGNQFQITPTGENIVSRYGTYSAYKKSMSEKTVTPVVLSTAPISEPVKNKMSGKTILIWTIVLLAVAIGGILFTLSYHKG